MSNKKYQSVIFKKPKISPTISKKFEIAPNVVKQNISTEISPKPLPIINKIEQKNISTQVSPVFSKDIKFYNKEYTFIKNRMYPHSNQKSGGLLYLNLLPHPIEVHGTLEAANEQTYTIKKKSAE